MIGPTQAYLTRLARVSHQPKLRTLAVREEAMARRTGVTADDEPTIAEMLDKQRIVFAPAFIRRAFGG